MEFCVQLKVCEGCGCLWFRAQHRECVYCSGCEMRFAEFPSPETRKTRGRPSRKAAGRAWGVSPAAGGAV